MKTFDYTLRDKVRKEVSKEQIQLTKNYYEERIEYLHKMIDTLANPEDLYYAWHSLFQVNLALAYYVDDEYCNMIINTNLPYCSEKCMHYKLFSDTIKGIEPEDLYSLPVNAPAKDIKIEELTKPLITNDQNVNISDPFDGHTPYFDMTTTLENFETNSQYDNKHVINEQNEYQQISLNNINDIDLKNDEELLSKLHNDSFSLLKELKLENESKQAHNIKDEHSHLEVTLNTELDKKNLEKYNFVNHPTHYNSYDVEVIEMMRRIWGDEAVILWCKLTAYKYRMRMGSKPTDPISQDLEKEAWYLNKAKELQEIFKK